MTASLPSAVVEEVLRFEDLPVGSLASWRVVVRWSDGTEGECLRWYGDEVLICEGDLIGKTREQLRSLLFHWDRNWLQSRARPQLPGTPAGRFAAVRWGGDTGNDGVPADGTAAPPLGDAVGVVVTRLLAEDRIVP